MSYPIQRSLAAGAHGVRIGGRAVGLGLVLSVMWSTGADAGVSFQIADPPPPAHTEIMRELGAWSYVVAPLLMVAVAILPFPAEVPALLNGAIFGTVIGTLITWIGAVVGAIISFELARRLGRPLATRVLGDRAMLRADRIVQSAGWPGLILARLIPLVAFTALNWCAGFANVSRRRFIWTTSVGILPATFLFTLSGSTLADAYAMHSTVRWMVVALMVGVVIAAVVRYRGHFSSTKGLAPGSRRAPHRATDP